MLEVTFNCKNLLHISTVHHSDDIIGKYICLCIWEQVKAKANTGGLDCNKKYSDKNKTWKKKSTYLLGSYKLGNAVREEMNYY